MSPRLELSLEDDTCAPGGTIRGRVLVVEGGRSRSLVASLEYVEETQDYRDVGKAISGGPLHEGELVAGAEFPFALQLPADALPEYRSQHGELYWQVHVRSDEFGIDTHVRHRIALTHPTDG